MKINFENAELDLTPSGKNYNVSVGEKSSFVEIIKSENGQLDVLMDGQHVTAYVSSDGAKRWVTVNGRTFILTKLSGARRGGIRRDHAGELAAPMPGQVRAVNVSVGDAVSKGQTLLVVEAMKMEIRIQAPVNGIVSSVSVEVGQTVEREQILAELKENEPQRRRERGEKI